MGARWSQCFDCNTEDKEEEGSNASSASFHPPAKVVRRALTLSESLFIYQGAKSFPVDQPERILVAACDLDKTLFPPDGPNHALQLRKNIEAMVAFEEVGGFVFPVTGNNITMAQRKFMDPNNGTAMLRDVARHPGIFGNGGLVLGPDGVILDKQALGDLYLRDPLMVTSKAATSGSLGGDRLDFISGLLNFVDDNMHGALLQGFGLLFIGPDFVAGYESMYQNVDEFAAMQRVESRRATRQDIINFKSDILSAVLLYLPIQETDKQAARQEYDQVIFPRQQAVMEAMRQYGLMDCSYDWDENDVDFRNLPGNGIKLTLMKDPWPEIDINVAGVDKGHALARFLTSKEVLAYLGQDHVDPATQVAVFGDAPNDVPMFKDVGGTVPGVRVEMPMADDPVLDEHSNMRAEVSEVLMRIRNDKRARAPVGNTF